MATWKYSGKELSQEEIALGQAQVEIAFAPVVGQGFRMKWVFPATT